MSKATKSSSKPEPASSGSLGLDEIASAVESGAGLSAVTRAAAAALEASLAVTDSRGAVIAVAAASPADEKRLLAGEGGTATHELTVAERNVGTLKVRSRVEDEIDAVTLRMVSTLIALELERTLAPELADLSRAGEFIAAVIAGELKEPAAVSAAAEELGLKIEGGCAFMLVRAVPRKAVDDGWRERLALVVERGARAHRSQSVTALVVRDGASAGEVFVLLPGNSQDSVIKEAELIHEEVIASLPELAAKVGYGRVTAEPGELFRAGQEALLAVNVAEASGETDVLGFEDTGAYRLLLSALCDDPGELRRFYAETIEPLVDYDTQYETDLVHTVETFLAADGNVAGAAQRLFTHRHTVRYRLERVKDLTGLDCSSTDGREKLSLGLKSMRVLGIANPGGPAREHGAEGGRVPG